MLAMNKKFNLRIYFDRLCRNLCNLPFLFVLSVAILITHYLLTEYNNISLASLAVIYLSLFALVLRIKDIKIIIESYLIIFILIILSGLFLFKLNSNTPLIPLFPFLILILLLIVFYNLVSQSKESKVFIDLERSSSSLNFFYNLYAYHKFCFVALLFSFMESIYIAFIFQWASIGIEPIGFVFVFLAMLVSVLFNSMLAFIGMLFFTSGKKIKWSFKFNFLFINILVSSLNIYILSFVLILTNLIFKI